MSDPIRITPLPAQRETVVAIKLDGPYLLRPFMTYVVDHTTGEIEAATFATEAAALQADEVCVRNGGQV